MSAPSYIMVMINALAIALLLLTANRVHADMMIAVAHAFILLCLSVNIVYNIVMIIMRRRAILRKREFNSI